MSNFKKYFIETIPLYAVLLLAGIVIFTDNSTLRDIAMVLTFILSVIVLIGVLRLEKKERIKRSKEE